jgi:hypothetical protein
MKMPAMTTAAIPLLRCVILLSFPCIPYLLHWIHLLGDPTEEQDTSEGRGPQTDASGYLRNGE